MNLERTQHKRRKFILYVNVAVKRRKFILYVNVGIKRRKFILYVNVAVKRRKFILYMNVAVKRRKYILYVNVRVKRRKFILAVNVAVKELSHRWQPSEMGESIQTPIRAFWDGIKPSHATKSRMRAMIGWLCAECWVLSAECWVLSAECWVLSAECWVLSAECWVQAKQLFINNTGLLISTINSAQLVHFNTKKFKVQYRWTLETKNLSIMRKGLLWVEGYLQWVDSYSNNEYIG
jgi:hypothetical protein